MKGKFYLFAVLVGLLCVVVPVSAGGSQEGEGADLSGAEPVELVVIGHQIHQNFMMGQNGGANLVDEFVDSHPGVSGVRFITAPTPGVRDRLFREASLANTDIDVGHVYTPWVSPRVTELFKPLDGYMTDRPVEAWEDIFEGLRASLEINGNLYGVPMRAGTDGALIYNKAIFRERGIDNPPETWEELVSLAKELTFTRTSGEQVYGLVDMGVKQEGPFSFGRWIRTRDGDFMTLDYEVTVSTSPEVVQTLREYKELYDAGALGPNWSSQTNSDRITLFKSGRAAMIGAGADYVAQLTGEDGIPRDDIGVVPIPPAEGYEVTHPIVFQWAFVIPKGSRNKDAAWDFVRFMSSRNATLQMALSGNSPVRASTFDDSTFTDSLAYDPQVKLSSLTNGRILFPGFDNFPESRDFLGEQLQRILLGDVEIEEGLATAQRRLEELAPEVD